MGGVTTTSFGLLIAFLLPGLIGLMGLAFWSEAIEDVFATFITKEANIGLLLLVTLSALTLGLVVSVFRWVLFELVLCHGDQLTPEDFEGLVADETRLEAFRAIADQHYRYHQFWGGITITLPILFLGLLRQASDSLGGVRWTLGVTVGFLVVEFAMAVAAREAYLRYVRRGRSILKGGASHA
jgi:hypothetical protein